MRWLSAKCPSAGSPGAAVLAFSCAACSAPSCDTSGFEQLTSKAPRVIDLPGEELGAAGSLVPVQGLGREGRFEALAGIDEDGEVRIVRRDGTACVATALPAGTPPGRALPAAAEDLVMVAEPSATDTDPTLHLYDMDCTEPLPAFADAVPIVASERLVPFRSLIRAGSDLFAIAAAERSRRKLSGDVVSAFITAEHVIAQRGARLAVWDLALEPLGEHGSEVTEVVLLEGRGKLVFVDQGALFRLDAPTLDPVRLDDDACEVKSADGPSRTRRGARYVSAFSPCSERRLVVYDLEESTRLEVGPAASSWAVAAPPPSDASELDVFFQTADQDGATTLNVFRAGATRALGVGSPAGVGVRREQGTLVWLEDGGQGPLVRVDDRQVETLYDSVEGFEAGSAPERALISGDEGPSLWALEGFARPKRLAERAANAGRTGPAGLLFVESVEDTVGQLRLLDVETWQVEDVASQVHAPSANFWFSGETLFYLDEYARDEERGRLCMRTVASKDTFCESDVHSFRVLNRPERGVVLVKGGAGRARLFWAAVE